MSNWKTEFQSAFKNLSSLYEFLEWPLPEKLQVVVQSYSLFIPKNLAFKIKQLGPDSALAKQFLPHEDELSEVGFKDPIGDQPHSKGAQLVHRYSSRVLFFPTTVCPVHCRYCFRKNELNTSDEIFSPDFQETLRYLEEHPEISEIIFSGGDPLTLSDEKIAFYLESFAKIKSIKDIRFHTRYPVILPSRITDEFIQMLRGFKKYFRTISIAVHCNHAQELDEENRKVIKSLKEFNLLSQTVLLKGVNDSSRELITLMNDFLDLGIRPYYLHHPDQVKGGMHFYLPIKEGRTIYHALRNHLPGWALPLYIIDIPQGHGKVVASNPETFEYNGQLLSLNGDIISSPEPSY